MDNGQGSETVKVGDVMVGDTELTVGLTEETEGEGVFTVCEGVVNVGVTFRTIEHEPMFPFASVLMRKAPPAPKDSILPVTMYPPSGVC
jgi:hypothetical protein